MFLALVFLAFQEPLPRLLPESDSQGETVTMEEVQAKLAEVTIKFAEADARLRETVRQFDDLSLAETASSEAQPLLLQEAAKASLELVAEMDALLELLPAPPPSQGDGQGNPESPGSGESGNKPSQGMPKPSHQEGNQKQSSLLDQSLNDFLRNPRDGQWGKLPPRLQQAIDNTSAEEVPLRYRRWLVEYHRQDQVENDNE
jgi:hypothetical protein